MTAWNLTLLAVHCLATYAFATLYSKTPDRLQKVVIWAMMISQYLMVLAYSFAMAGDRFSVEASALIRWIAQEIEHVGVLFYVLRLLYKEKVLCQSGLPSSRN